MLDIRGRLLSLEDPANADLQFKLAPGLRREDMLGIRFPALRQLAKEIQKSPESDRMPCFFLPVVLQFISLN